jgi:hypothetical protein
MINSQNKSNQNRKKLKPVFAGITLSILILFLAITQLYESGLVIKRAQQSPNELHAQAGEKFFLADRREVFGVEGKVALLNFDQFVAEDHRRVAKLMIFFWGNPDELVGKTYRVEATNQYSEKLLLSKGTLTSALNSEDAHTLTSFTPFPKEGEWQLSFYVGDALYEEFTLNVLPPFPKTEHYEIINSPAELNVGIESPVTIESSWEDKKEIEVKLLNEAGEVIDQDIFKQDAMNYDASTSHPVYLFDGTLTFPKRGTWELEIDGEKTKLFVN